MTEPIDVDDLPDTHNEACFAARIMALRADIQRASDELAADEPFAGAYLPYRNILENALERDATWAAEDAYGEEHAPFDEEAENRHRAENRLACAALGKENEP